MAKKKINPEDIPKPNVLPILAIGMIVVGSGTVFYHLVEKLTVLDSVYFSVITLTTIGYGDIVPHTNAGKIFTIFYVLVGISLLAAIANFLLRQALIQRWQKKHLIIHKDGEEEEIN